MHGYARGARRRRQRERGGAAALLATRDLGFLCSWYAGLGVAVLAAHRFILARGLGLPAIWLTYFGVQFSRAVVFPVRAGMVARPAWTRRRQPSIPDRPRDRHLRPGGRAATGRQGCGGSAWFFLRGGRSCESCSMVLEGVFRSHGNTRKYAYERHHPAQTHGVTPFFLNFYARLTRRRTPRPQASRSGPVRRPRRHR